MTEEQFENMDEYLIAAVDIALEFPGLPQEQALRKKIRQTQGEQMLLQLQLKEYKKSTLRGTH